MRHFFTAFWKARTWREGHTWEKGDPSPPGSQSGHFHARLGRPRCRDWGARSCGARGGLSREGRGPRGSAWECEGRRPAARREPGAGEGGPRQAAPRAQGASPRRPPGGVAGAGEGWPAECRLPPSRRGNVGARTGAARLGCTGRASKTRGPPHKLLALLRAPPRGRLLGAAKARARCGPRGPPRLGGVSEGPLKEGVPGGDPHSLLLGVETQGHAAHTRDQWSLRKPTSTCLGSSRAPPSCFLCYVSD